MMITRVMTLGSDGYAAKRSSEASRCPDGRGGKRRTVKHRRSRPRVASALAGFSALYITWSGLP
jgi:hypothetical protein